MLKGRCPFSSWTPKSLVCPNVTKTRLVIELVDPKNVKLDSNRKKTYQENSQPYTQIFNVSYLYEFKPYTQIFKVSYLYSKSACHQNSVECNTFMN